MFEVKASTTSSEATQGGRTYRRAKALEDVPLETFWSFKATAPTECRVSQLPMLLWQLQGLDLVCNCSRQMRYLSQPGNTGMCIMSIVRIRTCRIGANPEKSDLVNFWGPDWRKFSELCVLLFFLGKIDKMFPKSRLSKTNFRRLSGDN